MIDSSTVLSILTQLPMLRTLRFDKVTLTPSQPALPPSTRADMNALSLDNTSPAMLTGFESAGKQLAESHGFFAFLDLFKNVGLLDLRHAMATVYISSEDITSLQVNEMPSALCVRSLRIHDSERSLITAYLLKVLRESNAVNNLQYIQVSTVEKLGFEQLKSTIRRSSDSLEHISLTLMSDYSPGDDEYPEYPIRE